MNVLLIEDDQDISEPLQLIHAMEGHTATVCACRQEALTLFIKSPKLFDWIVTDNFMPGLGLIRFVEEARCIRPDIPIVIFSASSDFSKLRKQLPLTGIYYVNKPGFDDLFAVLRVPRS
jgi:CheY-like chemotaxis protein